MDIHEFDAIRPYNEDEIQQACKDLLADRQFSKILQRFLPFLPKFARHGVLRLALIGVKSGLDFQRRFMKPVVNLIITRCTKGVTFNHDAIEKGVARYTYLSNHRDIVLDSAFLDVKLFEQGFETTVEIAIGDNLLIYPWIERLVKINKCFTVRRALSPREMFKSSELMSRYIHYAINEKHENVWIAQREGRAKDSNDRTQESVLKMLAMGGNDATHVGCLKHVHIVPLTISYEYDPCDYLKAKEFQLKRDNVQYRKTRQDDLTNMKVGIFGQKGRVVYTCAPCINEWLDELQDVADNYFYEEVARRIDIEIHKNYELFPCNYIAIDLLDGNRAHEEFYTAKDEQTFAEYLEKQLAKIDIPNKDEAFLRERMLTMYANPARNKLAALAAV